MPAKTVVHLLLELGSILPAGFHPWKRGLFHLGCLKKLRSHTAAMGAHKLSTARPTAAGKVTLIAVACVTVLVFVQFRIYEQNWDKASLKSGYTETGQAVHSLLKLPYSRVQRLHIDDILQALKDCDDRNNMDKLKASSDCLMELSDQHPSLSQLVRLSRQTSAAEKPHENFINDNILISDLKKKIDALGTMLKQSAVFLELKDTRESGLSDTDRNWFMSSLQGDSPNGHPESFEFPSEASQGRLLCLQGNDTKDGTQNRYGFSWKGSLPSGATLLPGLTFVADNYWDYQNPWHSMSSLVSFVFWRHQNQCAAPARLILYHWGELVPSMGPWISNILHASFGRHMNVERLDSKVPICLERAVVHRRGIGHMSIPNLNSMFATVRCKARTYCGLPDPGLTTEDKTNLLVKVTLFLRSGARSFKDDTGVEKVVRTECLKAGNCQLQVARVSNLSFCEQVAILSSTDVLITTHGAQLTNMIFMSPGGAVMEMIPKGWLEFAGVGQYIYSWLAEWSNLQHEGLWWDNQGPECPFSKGESLKCFLFHKDSRVGHNETHLGQWTAGVLGKQIARKLETRPVHKMCYCDAVDNVLSR